MAVSMAVAKAAAEEAGLPLYRYFGGSGAMQMPVPMMNIVNGGARQQQPGHPGIHDHAGVADELPRSPALRRRRSFHALKKILSDKGMSTAVWRRGRLRTNFASNEAVPEHRCAGHREGRLPCRRRCPAGARTARRTEFYHEGEGQYHLEGEGLETDLGRSSPTTWPTCATNSRSCRSRTAWPKSDWEGWKVLTDKLGKRVQLVGDDLFVTNTKILKEGIEKGIGNSILIKINQIGTLTETFAAIEMAKRAGYTAVISHRSGETEDSTIADIAVGTNAGQIKTGSLSRSDRISKYNQLLRIEEDLGDIASYPGKSAFYNLR
ncbi:phosphopyruvate hydratase [Cupriavidus basilensis]